MKPGERNETWLSVKRYVLFFILKTGLIKAKESKACRKNSFPFYSTEVISVHIIPQFNIVQFFF